MIADYQKAKKQADLVYRTSVLSGKYPYLPALDEMVEKINALSQYHVGVCEIPLSLVVGTKTAGRQNAFVRGFLPRLDVDTEFALKWSNLYDAQQNEGIRDPIKCYEYMNHFYVEEGNKRVSVLKAVGASAVTADVTRILPPRSDEPQVRCYYEFLRFFNVTHLYSIVFSREGSYEKLARVVGRNLYDPWPQEQVENLKAAYDVFSEIFASRGGEKIGGITTGDAFLTYLSVFSLHSLLDYSRDRIKNRITRLWKEFLTSAGGTAHMNVVQTPQVKKGIRDTGLKEIFLPTSYSQSRPLRVAFIYDQKMEDSSWVYGHELGRTHVEERFKGSVETVPFEDCSTREAVEGAIEAAIEDEDEVIFTTSAEMMPAAIRLAIAHPEVKILNCSVNVPSNAVRGYYARMYEARFLMGMLAGTQAKNHLIGCWAHLPIFGSISNINAFALGAATVDPQARVILRWGTDRERGEFCEQDILDAGARVILGRDMIRPKDPSKKFGLYEVMDDEKVRTLAAPVWQWGRYYELILERILDGSWNSRSQTRADATVNYWWGMSAGVIDVILSEQLSYHQKFLVDLVREGIVAGRTDPFGGEIRDQKGNVRHRQGDAPLSPEQIITMDYLVENVDGCIPKASQLTDKARIVVEAAGVSGTAQTQD